LARAGYEPLDSGEAVFRLVDRITALLISGSISTQSIAVADMDGDGDLDVLLGNSGSPSLVLLNAGDGTFPISVELSGSSAPTSSIVAADVDGDGDLDVLLGNSGSPSLVLLNAGDSTFPISVELPGGSAPTSSIAAADVDGDGDLDVLLGNHNTPSRVLLNAGDGSFPTSIELPGGSAPTSSIAAADVDGDGVLDVLLGNQGSPSRVLLNAGDGTFPISVELPGGSAPTSSIAAADVDGDGDLDVLLGNHNTPSRVLLNAGDGSFPTSIELPGGSVPTRSIAAADVDGDGDLDVLLGNHNTPSRVLLNAGIGSFSTSIELPGDSVQTKSIAAADVDGDGDLDVLLGNYNSPSRVLLTAGGGTFPMSIELPGDNAYTYSIAAADVDGDGDLDVLLGNLGSPSRVLLNAGDGTFPAFIELPVFVSDFGGIASTYSIAAADVDGDGDLDVLLGNWDSPSYVLLNAGDGSFPTSTELPGGSAQTKSIAAADVDGDGDLDVLLGIGNYGSPSRVLLNAGDGTFPMSIELPGDNAYTYSIAAADVDGDGDLDVLLGNSGSPSRVLLNAGNGSFPTIIELPVDQVFTTSIAAADVDGDGDLDVLLGNHNTPSLVLLNTGNGSFPTSIELPSGNVPTRSIAAADVDGDGDLDVLLGNHNTPSRVLLNTGNGSFPTSIELPSGSVPSRSIAAADVDGDGDLDVLLGNDYDRASHLLPYIRCSQPGTARSRFGYGCVRCPAPTSRRDDSFDVCYECDEHMELDVRGECSPCKPGYDRSLGAAECTACPRGKRQGEVGTFCVDCSPGTYVTSEGLFGPTCAEDAAASLDAAAPTIIMGQIVSALLSSVALLVMLWLAVACRRRQLRYKRTCAQLMNDEGVSLKVLRLRDRLSSSGGSSVAAVPSVRSDESTHLEVLDFSTLTIGRQIGQGGFATVWTARWQGNNLAVKVLNMETIDESAAHQEVAMLQEVAILRRLRHPCICTLFGHMRVEQRPALVLEYMAGGSLASYLFDPRPASCNVDPFSETVQSTVSSLNAAWRRFTRASKSPFALDAASALVAPQASLGRQLMETPTRPHLDDKKIRFGVQLASGLCFLHSHGILHSDVKTDNALLDATHTVCKLADFGLASLSLPNHARRHRGDADRASVGGTLRYLAPERIDALLSVAGGNGRGSSSGSLSLGRTLVNFEDRVDVYAFAFLLWELTHERRAYEGMTGVDAAFGASHGLRPNFSEPSHRHGILYRALTAECWARRPEDRPSMSTVLERLETCMQALSATQRSASTEPSLSGRTSSSNFDAAPMANTTTTKLACDDFVPYGPAERENTAKVVGHDFLHYVPADGEHADI
jgi:serine/threonine protein kinase